MLSRRYLGQKVIDMPLQQVRAQGFEFCVSMCAGWERFAYYDQQHDAQIWWEFQVTAAWMILKPKQVGNTHTWYICHRFFQVYHFCLCFAIHNASSNRRYVARTFCTVPFSKVHIAMMRYRPWRERKAKRRGLQGVGRQLYGLRRFLNGFSD